MTAILTLVVLFSLTVGFAQVRTSWSYHVQSDSINIGGGFSSSTNFSQDSTVGEVATGIGTSTSYQLRAGYQQMQEVFISISDATDVILSPSIAGMTGGTSNGSTTVTVITDSPAGYSLTLTSQATPAMNNGSYSIADYDEGADADYSFITPTAQAVFGFSPTSVDVVQAFKDNSALCGVGSLDSTLACWAGLSESGTVISQGPVANHPNGATTTIHFRVGVSSGAGVIAGVYTATTTLTALAL